MPSASFEEALRATRAARSDARRALAAPYYRVHIPSSPAVASVALQATLGASKIVQDAPVEQMPQVAVVETPTFVSTAVEDEASLSRHLEFVRDADAALKLLRMEVTGGRQSDLPSSPSAQGRSPSRESSTPVGAASPLTPPASSPVTQARAEQLAAAVVAQPVLPLVPPTAWATIDAESPKGRTASPAVDPASSRLQVPLPLSPMQSISALMSAVSAANADAERAAALAAHVAATAASNPVPAGAHVHPGELARSVADAVTAGVRAGRVSLPRDADADIAVLRARVIRDELSRTASASPSRAPAVSAADDLPVTMSNLEYLERTRVEAEGKTLRAGVLAVLEAERAAASGSAAEPVDLRAVFSDAVTQYVASHPTPASAIALQRTVETRDQIMAGVVLVHEGKTWVPSWAVLSRVRGFHTFSSEAAARAGGLHSERSISVPAARLCVAFIVDSSSPATPPARVVFKVSPPTGVDDAPIFFCARHASEHTAWAQALSTAGVTQTHADTSSPGAANVTPHLSGATSSPARSPPPVPQFGAAASMVASMRTSPTVIPQFKMPASPVVSPIVLRAPGSPGSPRVSAASLRGVALPDGLDPSFAADFLRLVAMPDDVFDGVGSLTAIPLLSTEHGRALSVLRDPVTGRTAVHTAALRGSIKLVIALVAAGGDVRSRDARGLSPLALAVQSGSVRVVEWLLAHGANPTQACNHGLHPLHRAVLAGSAACVKLLIDAGADARQRDSNGFTPDSLCSYLITTLENAEGTNAGPDIGTFKMNDALPDRAAAALAVRQQKLAALRDARDALPKISPSNVPLQLSREIFDFLSSAEGGDAEKVNHALSVSKAARTTLLAARGRQNRSAVLLAAQGGSVKVLEVLDTYGADFADVDAGGRNALSLACRDGQLAAVEWLLRRGLRADTAPARTLVTPLHEAVLGGNTDIVRAVLKSSSGNAAIISRDANGRTPLALAVIRASPKSKFSFNAAEILEVLRAHIVALRTSDPAIAAAFDPSQLASLSAPPSPAPIVAPSPTAASSGSVPGASASSPSSPLVTSVPLFEETPAPATNTAVAAASVSEPAPASPVVRATSSRSVTFADEAPAISPPPSSSAAAAAPAAATNATLPTAATGVSEPEFVDEDEYESADVHFEPAVPPASPSSASSAPSRAPGASRRAGAPPPAPEPPKGLDELKKNAFSAAARNDVEMLRALMAASNGALTVGVRDAKNGLELMHFAARYGALDVVNWLVTMGASVNAADVNEVTPLHYAVLSLKRDVAAALISAGAQIDAKDANGFTPFELARHRERKGTKLPEDLIELLTVRPAAPAAVAAPSEPVAEDLAAPVPAPAPAPVSAPVSTPALAPPVPVPSPAPAQVASLDDTAHARATQELQSSSSDLVTLSLNFFQACTACDIPALKRLLSSADADALVLATEDAEPHRSGLHFAASSGSAGIIRAIVGCGANVNVLDSERRTPLAYAARNGHADVVEVLIALGASPSAADSVGLTPLHMAVLADAEPVVKLLLRKGADVSAMDINGRTPGDLAAKLKKAVAKVFAPVETAVKVSELPPPVSTPAAAPSAVPPHSRRFDPRPVGGFDVT